MGKIQELSERLANQIAAGEVVERPASVVKELVENSVDAGSTQIDIFIEEAGLRKIQVIDNGEGIAEEDVVTAFKRHATSKIHNRDDLFRIRTLGFRGEALPSIASVSILTIETAVKDASQGSFLRLKGGTVEEHIPANLRQGTKITVENLFYNTPARLKYVKTLQTELANIGDIVNRIALSHPEVAFRLVHEGNKMLTTTGSGDLKQTIAGIYGVETAKKMLAINSEDLDFKLTGYVSLPEVTRASRNYLSTIINGRYIRNFALNKAIVAGYGSKLMVGRFPIAVLEITMDPLLVDVNVHPTKQEVRLSKEEELTKLISKSINDSLREENLIPNAADNLRFKKKVTTEPVEQTKLDLGTSPTTSSGLTFNRETGKFQVASSGYQQTVDNFVENPVEEGGKLPESAEQREKAPESSAYSVENQAVFDSLEETLPNKTLRDPFAATVPVTEIVQEDDQPAASVLEDASQQDLSLIEEQAQERLHPELHAGQKNYTKYVDRLLEETPAKQRFPHLEYFGQMHGTYLFAQSDEGLYIVDQHAAQERIKYEYFREKIGEVSDDLQELLVPIVLDYPNNDAIKLKEQTEKLQEVGIHLEEFGANSFIVRAHPTWYPAGEEESIIREMIDMLLETGSVSVKKFREATAIMMSCKRSIKANHYLNEAQARILLADLAKCENPFNCPHGRPVLIHFTNSDMERMFKRIQDPHRARSGME
ncbi:DNA mismatch repair endonuclease MutL [Enterococcus gallinarum]|uniref:DNA mismatch repair protein MutL n=1 Tax=Enterococcus gallinarum TaxID=1353 RepID=A0ABD4ZP98_ENTGA|nr:DNA mismatch repair endonuclease MutL [Enterococcus gallinarum]MBF0820500.1 DNA mismatch repair endonuclease MutL [Enterococcus faecalis]MBF0725926.1 DNA mismatch repair endonuclease MutL [Enterococcus gallinarum]MBF0797752.1 DNA mismatch repair endonuclease MutL [Enterococcus gallinarum]MBX8977250.1 DNA mismatch repair endonuclease MutL [Enterococcus gallinarum]MDL4873455.1 DNA mismatch repair endonuclease MutL [Enterococcus gallinarum]